jgi:dTDP-4-dehydrorhamnose 3,5-epimerase
VEVSIDMPFRFKPLEIADVILVEPITFEDARGQFMELYKRSAFLSGGITATFVQDNFSRSACHVLRGLHYQLPPKAQGKLVSVMAGEIFDVAVDLRKGSPTLGRWVSATLSAENRNMLYVPEGFAHGFCVLSERADVVYKVTAEYAPDLDRGIVWDDPILNITWPVVMPILSPKDARLPRLGEVEVGPDFVSSGRPR